MKHWQETRQLFDRASRLLADGLDCALGTVVSVEGSAYRRPGAKMLMDGQGRTWGGVSGGCLEADVREVALRVMQRGEPAMRRYDTGAEEDVVWGLGLGCNGSVEILIEPLASTDRRAVALLSAALNRLGGGAPFAIATALPGGRVPPGTVSADRARPQSPVLVDLPELAGSVTDGRAPQASLVDPRGHAPPVIPSTGGANALRSLARSALANGATARVRDGDLAAFVDVLRPPPDVLVCGAGDDAIPLASAAGQAGFRVTVADHRAAYLTRERFPEANLLDPAGFQPAQAEGDYAVVMTHDLARDSDWVRRLIEGGAAYVGLLGPRARRERIVSELDRHCRDAVYGPAGLDLGADGPEQVAFSIVAEILAVHSGRSPRHLRERDGPIHDRDPGAAHT